MSKNTKKSQGLQSLATLVAVEPEADVVEACLNELQSLPVFAVWEQITELESEIQMYNEKASSLVRLQQEAGRVINALHQWKSNLKSKLYMGSGITDERAKQGPNLGKFIDQLVEKAVAQSSTASRMQEEARALVAQAEDAQRAANRVMSLRSAKSALETEAKTLLGSINL